MQEAPVAATQLATQQQQRFLPDPNTQSYNSTLNLSEIIPSNKNSLNYYNEYQQHHQHRQQIENLNKLSFFDQLQEHQFTYQELLLVGLLIAIIFISIVGNCLVCVAIFTDRRLRKLGNAFIVSLAIADLFVSCLVMTFALCNDLMNYWIFGDWFCDVWISFDIMCSTASILNLCAISLDRFIHIKDCLLYNQWMTRKVALSAVIIIWFISALVSFVPINLGWHKPGTSGVAIPTTTTISPFTETTSHNYEQTEASFQEQALPELPQAQGWHMKPEESGRRQGGPLNKRQTEQQQVNSLAPATFEAPAPAPTKLNYSQATTTTTTTAAAIEQSAPAQIIVVEREARSNSHFEASLERPIENQSSPGGPQSPVHDASELPSIGGGLTEQPRDAIAEALPRAQESRLELSESERRSRIRRSRTDFVTSAWSSSSSSSSPFSRQQQTGISRSSGRQNGTLPLPLPPTFSPPETFASLSGTPTSIHHTHPHHHHDKRRMKTKRANLTNSCPPESSSRPRRSDEQPEEPDQGGSEQQQFNQVVEHNNPGGLETRLAGNRKEERRKRQSGSISSPVENKQATTTTTTNLEAAAGELPVAVIVANYQATSVHQHQHHQQHHHHHHHTLPNPQQLQLQPQLEPVNQLPSCQLNLTPTYAIISSSISFYIPCIIMLGLYTKLFACARKHVRNIQAISKAPAPISLTYSPALPHPPNCSLSNSLTFDVDVNVNGNNRANTSKLFQPIASPLNRTWLKFRTNLKLKTTTDNNNNNDNNDHQQFAQANTTPTLTTTDKQISTSSATNRILLNNSGSKQRQAGNSSAGSLIPTDKHLKSGNKISFEDDKIAAVGLDNEAANEDDLLPDDQEAVNKRLVSIDQGEDEPFLKPKSAHDSAPAPAATNKEFPVVGKTEQTTTTTTNHQSASHLISVDVKQQQQKQSSSCLSSDQNTIHLHQHYHQYHQQQQQQQQHTIQQQQNRQLATHKAAMTLGIIMGTFLFCWVPFFCLNIIKAFCSDCIGASLFRAFTWLGYANSALNPIIYGIHNSEFRNAFNRIFFKHLNFKNSRYYTNRRFSYDVRNSNRNTLRYNQQQQHQQLNTSATTPQAARSTIKHHHHHLDHQSNISKKTQTKPKKSATTAKRKSQEQAAMLMTMSGNAREA